MLLTLLLPGLALFPVLREWGQYDALAVTRGEWWRLFTAHFLHLSVQHALMNAAGLLLCLLLFRDQLGGRVLCLWLLGLPWITGGLIHVLDRPGVTYAGLSGTLYGFWVMALVLGLRQFPWLHGALLGLTLARLVQEQRPGYDVGYLGDWLPGFVYVNAHAYGALGGLLLALAVLGLRRRSASATLPPPQ